MFGYERMKLLQRRSATTVTMSPLKRARLCLCPPGDDRAGKGILLATHRIDEPDAFELMRVQSQDSGRKLIDITEAVVDSHRLLKPRTPDGQAKD